MSWDEFRRTVRHARKRKRLGRDPRCENCGETNNRKLQKSGEKVLCARCRGMAQSLDPFERHHPAGKNNDPFAVKRPRNDHAVLSDMQGDWPIETLMNRNNDSFLEAAAFFRADHDQNLWKAEKQLVFAEFFEDLSEFRKSDSGTEFWKEFEEFRIRRQK